MKGEFKGSTVSIGRGKRADSELGTALKGKGDDAASNTGAGKADDQGPGIVLRHAPSYPRTDTGVPMKADPKARTLVWTDRDARSTSPAAPVLQSLRRAPFLPHESSGEGGGPSDLRVSLHLADKCSHALQPPQPYSLPP